MATAQEIISDPKFLALSPDDRRHVLATVDPTFAALNHADQNHVVTSFDQQPDVATKARQHLAGIAAGKDVPLGAVQPFAPDDTLSYNLADTSFGIDRQTAPGQATDKAGNVLPQGGTAPTAGDRLKQAAKGAQEMLAPAELDIPIVPGMGARQLYRRAQGIVSGAKREGRLAKEAWDRPGIGGKVEAVGHGLAAATSPIGGDAIAAPAEDLVAGNLGAATGGAAALAAPALIGEALGAARGPLGRATGAVGDAASEAAVRQGVKLVDPTGDFSAPAEAFVREHFAKGGTLGDIKAQATAAAEEAATAAKAAAETVRPRSGGKFIKRASEPEALPQLTAHELRAYKIGEDYYNRNINPREAMQMAFDEHPEVVHPSPSNEVAFAMFKAGLDGYELPKAVTGWRYGDLPKYGKSFNYADNAPEHGVSVMEIDGSADNPSLPTNDMFMGHRPVVRVSGFEAPWLGSDGEPLIIGAKKLANTAPRVVPPETIAAAKAAKASSKAMSDMADAIPESSPLNASKRVLGIAARGAGDYLAHKAGVPPAMTELAMQGLPGAESGGAIVQTAKLARDFAKSGTIRKWGSNTLAKWGNALRANDAGGLAAAASEGDQAAAGISDPAYGAVSHLGPNDLHAIYAGAPALYVDPDGKTHQIDIGSDQIAPLDRSSKGVSAVKEWPKTAGAPNENDAMLSDVLAAQRALPERFVKARAARFGSPLSGTIAADKPLGRYGADFNYGPDSGKLHDHYFNTVELSRQASDPTLMTDVPVHELGHAAWHDLAPVEQKRFVAIYEKNWQEMRDAAAKAGITADTPAGDPRIQAIAAAHPMPIVKYKPETAGGSAGHRYDEAFAELFGQYMANPSEFKATYPREYGYFRGLFGREYITPRPISYQREFKRELKQVNPS